MTDLSSILGTIVPRTIEHIHREYPNSLMMRLRDVGDLASPSQLHPAFYGCYDWHSAVHSHWQLVRIVRLFPDLINAEQVIGALETSFTPAKLRVEVDTLADRPGYETPYGMAWLLQLTAELREWDHAWMERLEGLESHAASAMTRYARTLPFPVRTGLHSQTAFAVGMTLDWCAVADRPDLADTLRTSSLRWFGSDRNAPIAYEPSGSDFLSASLAEADLMRRVLTGDELRQWLSGFLPADLDALQPVGLADPSDGQLSHFAGLNLSRAWMAEGIASTLVDDDPFRQTLMALAMRHREAGTEPALNDGYLISHWAPSFLIYLLTERGLGTTT